MNRILVTGAGRSGTTILGRLLNFAPETNYLLEPFNRYVWMHCPDYHAYIGDNSLGSKNAEYQRFIANVLGMRDLVPWPRHTGKSPLETLGIKLGLRRIIINTALARAKNRLLKPAHLIFKDPSACYLASHLVRDHDFKVVYTVRHPAALFEGRRELNWIFNPESFERQPDLIESFGALWEGLSPLRNGGILEQSIILWMCCYSTLLKLEKEFPDKVLRVRHEDWCMNPVQEIRDVYGKLGLQWTTRVERKVVNMTSGNSTKRKASSLASVESRDARKLVFKWKHAVTQEEFDTIKQFTSPLMQEYYPEGDFNYL